MAEQVPEFSGGCAPQQGAICIHTNKITDVCLDKDCIEDLRVYLTEDSQALMDHSAGARARSVELLKVSIDVEELAFQRGYNSVDLTFYYRVHGEATSNGVRSGSLDGVAVFQKRVVLYGGESSTKIYSSRHTGLPMPIAQQPPEAIVEVIDPMVLSSRVLESSEGSPRELTEIPEEIRNIFGRELVLDHAGRRMYLTIGQFSTIRLERDAQLTMPSGQYCVPQKTCAVDPGCQEDPCDVFSRIDFPYQAFFPQKPDCAQPAEGGAKS